MRFAARSDVGFVRKQNQDAVAVRSDDDGLGLVVVADGMGGEAAGDVASSLALEAVTRVFFQPETAAATVDRLTMAVQQANARIYEEARQVEPYAGMGTTIVAAAATQDEVCVAHVGDSRAYLLEGDGELRRLTQDHSLVNELVRRGQITAESAVHHPQRHVLSRSLGTEAEVQVEAGRFAWKAGDCLMLCSDGLTGCMTDEELAAVLLGHTEVGEQVRLLIEQALARGGHDNVTVAIVMHDGENHWRDCG